MNHCGYSLLIGVINNQKRLATVVRDANDAIATTERHNKKFETGA
jgi:hypothetical protein